MDTSRIKELRKLLKDERIGMSELIEIESAFDQIPYNELRDVKENAMAGDMLDEIEDYQSRLK